MNLIPRAFHTNLIQLIEETILELIIKALRLTFKS
jgi:hypothetical protein